MLESQEYSLKPSVLYCYDKTDRLSDTIDPNKIDFLSFMIGSENISDFQNHLYSKIITYDFLIIDCFDQNNQEKVEKAIQYSLMDVDDYKGKIIRSSDLEAKILDVYSIIKSK